MQPPESDRTREFIVPPASGPYYQSTFPPVEFAARRMRVAESIGPGAVAVVRGAPAGGASEIFRQYNEFYYLSGVEVPHAYLIIEGKNGRASIFLPGRDVKLERSEGAVLHADDPDRVRALTGLNGVHPLADLGRKLASATLLYTVLAPAEGRQAYRGTLDHARRLASTDPWHQYPPPETHFADLLRSTFPRANVCDLTPILDGLRLIKSPLEIEQMRRAGDLSAQAILAAMHACRPGMWEYQLAAIGEHLFRTNGAQGIGYAPIIASGANIWQAHYNRNHSALRDGSWVLMDFAPDCNYYTSDIGRIWPVNGRYLDWQRELYGFIVAYHKALLSRIRPGVTASQIMDEAASEMEYVFETTCWSKASYGHAAGEVLRFRGHVSHSVGMCVHDPGDTHEAPLKAGMVFSVDPQMWVPEEQLYVRVEDTVAVTSDGTENLTSVAPLDLDDVERAMGD